MAIAILRPVDAIQICGSVSRLEARKGSAQPRGNQRLLALLPTGAIFAQDLSSRRKPYVLLGRSESVRTTLHLLNTGRQDLLSTTAARAKRHQKRAKRAQRRRRQSMR